MAFPTQFTKLATAASFALAAAVVPFAHAQTLIEVPHAVEHSVDKGSVPSQQEFNITVHLKLHNEAAYHAAVQALYTAGSPTYHQWMTKADFAKYAPTAAEVELVKKELQSHGLTIVGSDETNFTVRAHGAAVNFERAFQTQLHQLDYKGNVVRANVTPAKLTGAAGDLVDSVTGLSGFNLKPHIVQPKNPKSGQAVARFALKKGQSLINLANYFTNNCFSPSITETLTTGGSTLPVGAFTGNSYLIGSTLACGWTPAQVQSWYGLNPAYKANIAGKGQTIVIIDEPTNSDFTTDFTEFSEDTGLPAVTSANYSLIYPDGAPTPLSLEYYDATGETQLDIEWAHAIAPQAKIDLLITPTGDWDEFEYAIQYAVANKLGNVISLSYGLPETLFGAYTVKGFEATIEQAAAAGIAVNISSGDGGDGGTGGVNAGGDSYPGASAFATSIGGTSIGIPGPKGTPVEVGWGTNQDILSFAQNDVLDPPLALGFDFGSGGGNSGFVAKPAWQSKLPGAGRHEPDISAVADPYTGAIIFAGGYVEAIGGTSLASPVFSGMWTLANELAGKSLGQAAPMLPSLTSKITDIVPINSTTNVSGTITDASGTSSYSAASLIAPVTYPVFYSALWDASGDGSGEIIDLSFSTDSSLVAVGGWDYVTGYGVPQDYAFIQAAAALK
jgi:subtilase family serine protease